MMTDGIRKTRATFFTLPTFWTDRIYLLVFYKEQKMPDFLINLFIFAME